MGHPRAIAALVTIVTPILGASADRPTPAVAATQAAKTFVDPATPATATPLTGIAGTPIGEATSAPATGRTWRLVFSDEFEDTTVDPSRWRVHDADRGWSGDVHAFWRAENVWENGRSLVIRFKQDSCWMCYSSGRVDSSDQFKFRYGYAEARIHITYPEGRQSAFWMMPPAGTLPRGVADGTASDGAEIDIVEANRQADMYSTNLHWDGYDEYHQSSLLQVHAPGLHTNYYNIFGLEWTRERLRFYFNGALVRVVTDPSHVPNVAEFPILSGGIFGTGWVDGDITRADLPSWMYVDWIRIYQ